MTFELYPLRFSFIAEEPICFGPGTAANTLRGALGTILRRLVCRPECKEARTCEFRQTCSYARVFEPSASGRTPSGFRNLPRPFVFRALHLDGMNIEPGAAFHFDLNLFQCDFATLRYLVLTFEELAREGLGPNRRRVLLNNVWQLNEAGAPSQLVYETGSLYTAGEFTPLKLSLVSRGELPVTRILVRFLTATELKSGEGIATRPEFLILAARLRDRISALGQFYGGGALPIDFQAFSRLAAQVVLTRSDLRPVASARRSTRTGQTHPLGGFVGEAEYEGELSAFVPYLNVARWTGVGRQTVWGKGAIDWGIPLNSAALR